MRRFLVDSFLPDVTQQIHSFRASGVISAQSLSAVTFDSMVLRKSAGSLWTVPPAIFGVVIYRAEPVSRNNQHHRPAQASEVRRSWIGACGGYAQAMANAVTYSAVDKTMPRNGTLNQ